MLELLIGLAILYALVKVFKSVTKDPEPIERPPIPSHFGVSRAPQPKPQTLTVIDEPIKELSPDITNAQQDLRLKEEIRKMTE